MNDGMDEHMDESMDEQPAAPAEDPALAEDRQAVERIVRESAQSFSGLESTRHWTRETIWFDAGPYAAKGARKAAAAFDQAFANMNSCEVSILDMRTFINGDAALVCSVLRCETVNLDGSPNPPFLMRRTDYLEWRDGAWRVLHEHSSHALGWDGVIDEEAPFPRRKKKKKKKDENPEEAAAPEAPASDDA